MFFSKEELKDWKIVVNYFHLNEKKGLNEQASNLDEDLLFLEKRNYGIDLGWYGVNHTEGTFRVTLVKDEEWYSPLKEKETREIKELKPIILDFMKIADND